jgi:hypothetical protein
MSRMVTWADQPWPGRAAAPPAVEPVFRELAHGLSFMVAANDAQLRALRLELALQDYGKRHGRFPAALADLSPGLLPQVPLDPFTEKPFVYRLSKPGYQLYSAGPNAMDDGGVPIQELSLESLYSTRVLGPMAYGRDPRNNPAPGDLPAAAHGLPLKR